MNPGLCGRQTYLQVSLQAPKIVVHLHESGDQRCSIALRDYTSERFLAFTRISSKQAWCSTVATVDNSLGTTRHSKLVQVTWSRTLMNVSIVRLIVLILGMTPIPCMHNHGKNNHK
jgi:acyl-CoA synthetase (AMP-forming)/AMP-acid ligase II